MDVGNASIRAQVPIAFSIFDLDNSGDTSAVASAVLNYKVLFYCIYLLPVHLQFVLTPARPPRFRLLSLQQRRARKLQLVKQLHH